MMGTQLCHSRVFSHSHEESGEEEMSVLPRHTKVVVTGNNRTKSVLVGLQGVVKKAVGLGGWHWLVLKNGVEVKLQRNALSVLEPPTGNEDDDDGYDFDYSSGGSDIGEKEKHQFSSAVEFRKFSKPRIRYAKPWVSAASTKFPGHNGCREFHSDIRKPQLGMNFAKLGTNSLWRYCQNFKLASISSDLTKEQLVNIVQPHFSSQHVDEVQVIVEFIQAAKRLRKKI